MRTIPREVGNLLEFKARANLRLTLSARQREILIGCLLGDAYIHPRGQIQIAQSIKQQSYLNWKYQELSSLAYGPPSTVSRFDTRYGKTYVGLRFWLRQYFKPLRKIFYPQGKKTYSHNLNKFVTGLTLTVWYMDDGNLYKSRHVKISTDGFSHQDCLSLQNMLAKKFKIETSIQASGKLRIACKSLPTFFNTITPFIHPSMIYKIP